MNKHYLPLPWLIPERLSQEQQKYMLWENEENQSHIIVWWVVQTSIYIERDMCRYRYKYK